MSAYAEVPYPVANAGQIRVLIPELVGAELVEVQIGKVVNVDCNAFAIAGGALSVQSLDGWGYNYYTYGNQQEKILSRGRVACPHLDRFVVAKFEPVPGTGFVGDHFFIRNSAYEKAFYVPTGYQVQFRAWAPTGELHQARP